MIVERKKRIILYGITFLVTMMLHTANYLLYFFAHLDGNFLLCASVFLPCAAVFFSRKLNFGQGIIASICISLPAHIFEKIDYCFEDRIDRCGDVFYGFGWALSIVLWFMAPLLLWVLIGGITTLVRAIKSAKKSDDLSDEIDS